MRKRIPVSVTASMWCISVQSSFTVRVFTAAGSFKATTSTSLLGLFAMAVPITSNLTAFEKRKDETFHFNTELQTAANPRSRMSLINWQLLRKSSHYPLLSSQKHDTGQYHEPDHSNLLPEARYVFKKHFDLSPSALRGMLDCMSVPYPFLIFAKLGT